MLCSYCTLEISDPTVMASASLQVSQFNQAIKSSICLVFTAFLDYCCLIISEKCVVTPSFLFGFQ